MWNANVADLRSDLGSSILPEHVVRDFVYSSESDSTKLVPHFLYAFELKKTGFYFVHQQNLDLDVPAILKQTILSLYSGDLPLVHQFGVCQILRQLQVAYVAQWDSKRFLIDAAVILAALA